MLSATRPLPFLLQPILLGLLALLHLLLFGVLAFLCPTLESAALLGSLSLLLAISVLRRRYASSLNASSYFLLGSALLTSGTTIILALCDAADWSLFGGGYDGQTGLLLGLLLVVPPGFVGALRFYPTANSAALAFILLAPGCVLFSIVELGRTFNNAFPWVMPLAALASVGAIFLALRRLEGSSSPWQRLLLTCGCAIVLSTTLGSGGDLVAAHLAQGLCGLVILWLFYRLQHLDGLGPALLVRVGFGSGLMLLFVKGLAPLFAIPQEIALYAALLPAFLPFFSLLLRRFGELTVISCWAVLGALAMVLITFSAMVPPPPNAAGLLNKFPFFCLFLALLHLWQRRKLLGRLDGWIDGQPLFPRFRTVLHLALCGFSFHLIVATANQPIRLLVKNIPAIELLIPRFPAGPNPLSLATLVTLAMHDTYLFQLQTPWRLTASDDPQLVIDSLSKETPDHFSYFNTHEELVNKGLIATEAPQVGRYGVAYQPLDDGWIISRVSIDSPAALAGLRRGDLLLSVDGEKIAKEQRPITKIVQPGTKVELMVKGREGVVRKINMVATASRKDPVFHRLLPTPEGPIGYLYLALFDYNAFSGLSTALMTMEKAGIRDLVLDLRDNRGGSIALQRQLTSQLLGRENVGKELQHYRYNHKYRDLNYSDRIEERGVTLPLQRLAILTSEETCSASEALINSLRPYLAVTTIGATTCGKPMMMDVLNIETKAGENQLALVNAEIVNSRGEGGYYNGITPTCRVTDNDFQHDLGDKNEALLKEALHLFNRGRCSQEATMAMAQGRR